MKRFDEAVGEALGLGSLQERLFALLALRYKLRQRGGRALVSLDDTSAHQRAKHLLGTSGPHLGAAQLHQARAGALLSPAQREGQQAGQPSLLAQKGSFTSTVQRLLPATIGGGQ